MSEYEADRVRKLSEQRKSSFSESEISKELERVVQQNEFLRENFDAATAAILAIRAEDEGWGPLNAMREHDGFAIRHLHEIYEKAKLQSKGNPLLKRGFSLRSSNIWGRGIEFVGKIPPRYQAKIDKNFSILFSQSAFVGLERSLFTAGNMFLAYDTRDDTCFPISFVEISNFASNPNRTADVRYYQRTWFPVDPSTGLPASDATIEWLPTLETWEQAQPGADKRSPLLGSIRNLPVNRDVVIIDVRVNRDEDEVWGIPDVLPAMPYAWAHSEYLRDGSKLLKALSTIAWKVVSKSKNNATTAGAKMASARGVAQTANMTADTDLVAMPKAGQVDLGDGDRIASYVAAALGVSLTALLSTAGAAGGSYGAEASLDGPTENDTIARQSVWVDSFYKRVLRVMGLKDVEVRFKHITTDPAYRNLQGLALAFQTGAINQEEYRAAVLAQMDISPTSDALPKPNAFTGAESTQPDLAAENSLEIAKMSQATQVKTAKLAATAPAAAAGPASATPGQGKTGKVGKMNSGDNTNRDAAHKPGTGNANS